MALRGSVHGILAVMACDTPSHTNQVLWPEFQELSKILHAYLDEATRGVHGDLSEVSEIPGLMSGE